MRLFIAINLPAEIKDYLFSLQGNVKDAKISWVAKKNLHLTLKFLGEVNEGQLPIIKEKIKIQSHKIEANLTDIGFFPSQRNPRVIWVGVEPEDQLIQLQQRVDEQLLSHFHSDQSFKSHITLGRVKMIRRNESFSKTLKELEIKKLNFTIDSFQLMKSEIRRGGSVYEVLESVTLS